MLVYETCLAYITLSYELYLSYVWIDKSGSNYTLSVKWNETLYDVT